MGAERLHSDDTTMPVMAKGKTATGRNRGAGYRPHDHSFTVLLLP